MKLDEEMRARCDAAYREFATAAEEKFVDGVSHMFLAGYRMALERAARALDQMTIETVGDSAATVNQCIHIIRALGDGA